MITIKDFEQARINLSNFILFKAEQIRNDIGIGFIAIDDAPNKFSDLLQAWEESLSKKQPFPIWNGASDSTIYTDAYVNYAFRFWHDYLHYTTGLEFIAHDEIKIGIMQVKDVQSHFG